MIHVRLCLKTSSWFGGSAVPADDRPDARPTTLFETEPKTDPRQQNIKHTIAKGIAVLLLCLSGAAAITPEEHASHHPDQAQSGSATTPNAEAAPAGGMMGGKGGKGKGGMMGGKGGGMGKMMEKMGAPKPRGLYPSLMGLPDLPQEKRQKIQQQAHDRMKAGAGLMSQALESLSRAAPTNDFAAMQGSTAQLREGLAQFESGLAAHRALAEGKAPRNVALRWFKKQMNLLPRGRGEMQRGWLGLSWVHFFVMGILILFAAAMIWMYFLKMRRAAALVQRIVTASDHEPDSPVGIRPASGGPAPSSKISGKLRVARIFQETPQVKTFRFVNDDGGPIHFTYLPGQFLTLTIQPGDKPIKRSYTIASSPTQRYYCEITVKRESQGVASTFLHDQIKEGDTLDAIGPSGKFTFCGDEAQSIVLIGGGVGITPLMGVTRYLTDVSWGNPIYFIYTCRTPEDFIFAQELRHLERRHANLHLLIAMSRIEQDIEGVQRGRLNKQVIADFVPNIVQQRIHMCGAAPMMESVKAMLAELGVPKEQIKTEAFGPAKKRQTPATPAAGAPEVTPETDTTSTTATIKFQKSNKSVPLPSDQTVLDVAEANGVDIDASCRIGTCGTCLVKLLSGDVTMEVDDGLEPDDKQQGMVLACQAKSDGNITVDA